MTHFLAMIRIRTRAAAVLVLAVTTLLAQPSADWNVVKALTPGTRIHVEVRPRTVSGQVRSVSDDAVVLQSGAGEETIARSQVSRLAVKQRGHRKRNVLIGLGVGVGAGAGIAVDASTC